MKIQFLGTAAAEGVPALFCDCETCRESRARGGRNIRTRSQALIDGALLIDMGPDTLMHELTQGLDFTHIENCLITHIHFDHFNKETFEMRRRGFSNLAPDTKPLCVFGSQELYDTLVPTDAVRAPAPDGTSLGEGGYANPDDSVLCYVLPPLTPTRIGQHEVTALNACHGTKQPYNYIIRNVADNKALLYAHDTSPWEDEAVWSYLETAKPHLDLVSMDCTYANNPHTGHRHHMCLLQNVALRERLLDIGVCDDKTVFISNHFSHNGVQALYDTFVNLAAEHGFLTSYDGMMVEF